MKKLILMLMLCAPMTMMAQKFGKVNTQQIMQSLPDVAKANGEMEALQKQKENDLKSMHCLGNQRTSEAEALCVVTQCAVNQLSTGSHVTPLVVTTQLETNTILFILIEEVVALEQLIGELSERQAVASLTVQALLHAILRHHVVYSDMLTNHTSEIKEGEVLHPVVVVHQLRLVRLIKANNRNQRRIFQHCNKLVAQRWDNAFKSLRHNNIPHHPAIPLSGS